MFNLKYLIDNDLTPEELAQEIISLASKHLKAKGVEISLREHSKAVLSLAGEWESEAENQGLCPKCLGSNMEQQTRHALVGEYMGTAAWKDEVVAVRCEDCDYKEVV